MQANNKLWQGVGLWLTFATLAAVLVLAALKLLGIITWSWWWVVAPFWVPFTLAVLLVVAAIIIIGVTTKPKYNEEDDSRDA